MKRIHLFAALAAFLLSTVCAGLSHAQTATQDGQKTYSQQAGLAGGLIRADSTMKALTMSTTGGLSTYDEDRDRDYVHLFQDCVGNASTGFSLAIGAADSTDDHNPLDVHAYRYLSLLIDPTFTTGDTNTVVRLIFQFRECMNGNQDSTSLFPVYMYGQNGMGVTAAAIDTSASGHLFRGNAGLAWSGEYEVTIAANRSAPTNSISVNGRLFSYPNNINIPLDTIFGRSVRFNKLSIRVRNAGYVATAQSATITGHIHLLGFAQ